MKNAILSMSATLLNSGVFNHLSDAEISSLHRLLLTNHLQPVSEQMIPLVRFWYIGDYWNAQDAQRLLQKSNEYLQYFGQPPIESVITAEMFEMA